MRDITLADTFYALFTTRAFASGVPTTLAGTPVVSAYENEGLTQITAGITLGVDHDGVTGLNLLTVVATGANGYEAGKDYGLVITVGTVGGVSVVGEVVAEFSIGRSAAAVDLANGTDGLGAIKNDTAATLVDTAEIGAAGAGLTAINLPNQTMDITGNITGNLSGSVGSVTGAVGSVTAGVTLAAAAVQAIWDALTSALTTVGSIGKLLVDNINATIGSRSSHSAADVWASATRTVTAATNITSTGGTTVPQTGDSFARLGAAGAGLTAVPWNATWDAEVESEVNDAIDTAIAELGVAIPTATPTLRTGMMLMYMALRNKLVVQTSGVDAIELYNDAGTKIAAKAITDDGADYTEAEMA